jgi:imidazolonepropionase-like amidohydrolase
LKTPLQWIAGVALLMPMLASAEPYESRYTPLPSEDTLFKGGTILTGTGEQLDETDVLVKDGKIARVGKDLRARGATVIELNGAWLTPGIIDVHSHLGAGGQPRVRAHSDINEATAPTTPDVWVEHSVWPQDQGFVTALAGGVTSLQILPGSANLIGGRSVTLKNVPALSVAEMKFPGAPYGLKMACGENPKRVYGSKGRTPSTRMGNVAGYRAAWIDALDYKAKIEKALEKDEVPPKRDLAKETLLGVLDGEILVHNHCYRADEMVTMLDIAEEFGYQITAFHHAVEAYKIADVLAEKNVCSAVWSDWWGFKMEAYDGVKENAAMLHQAGACAIVHSDDAHGIQRLNQETSKIVGAMARVGVTIPKATAIQWVTLNAAKSLGIDEMTGSIEPGKMADLVIWNNDPFSVYALAQQVYIDGALVFDRADVSRQPVMDLGLGNGVIGGGL